MKLISSIIAIVIIFTTVSIIPIVSSQELNHIEINEITFNQPEIINVTCWSDNSSSIIYLWSNYTGDIQFISSGIGIQTNITNSSDLNYGDYNVYCNSTWNSTLVWKTFSVVSLTTTTIETTTVTTTTVTELTTTIETTFSSSSTPTTSTIPSNVEDKEPPVWSNLRHEPSVVKESDSVNIIVEWSDNVDLDSVIIYENSTGAWKENVCDKTTGRCSLGIVNLSLTSTGLTNSLLIITLIIIFAVVIFLLIKVVHLSKIISSFLAIVIFILLLSIFLSPEISRNIIRTFSRLGIIPIAAGKIFSHTIPASDLSAGEVVGYYSYANDTSGNEAKTEINSFTVQSVEITTETSAPEKIETLSIKEEQEKAEINKPVKWSKELIVSNPSSNEVKGYNVTGLPKDAKKIIVKDENGSVIYTDKSSWKTDIAGKNDISYFVEYESPPPYKEESVIEPFVLGKKYEKRINVKSDFVEHYNNVKAYTDIPEELFKENYTIKVYHIINDSKVDVTDNSSYEVKFVDSDNNGLNDRIEWIVPQLSEEQFDVEASITIINVQSYPVVYGNWTVRFNTTGTANLTITPINNTNFDVEIKFLELRCGDNIVNPVYDGKSVFYENWTCSEEGRIVNEVLKEGKHTLEFSFGDDVEYAYNQAGLEYYINTSEAEQSTGTSWKEALSLTWNDSSNSRWLILASWESRHSATGADGNYKVSKDGIEQILYTERVLQANTEYISYFFPQIYQGDGGTVKYNISFNATSGTAYVRRVRLVAIRLDNLPNIDYNYSFIPTQVNSLDTTWGGPEDTNITISPSKDGLYLILASLAKASGNTGRSVLSRVVVNSEFIPSATGNFGSITDTATTEFHPFQVIALRKLTAGPHVISLQAISSNANSARIKDRSVIVIRLSDVFTFFNVSNTVETSTTLTTFQNMSTLTIPSGNNGNYLVLSMLTLKGTSGSGYYYESRTFSDDYGEIGKFQSFRPQASTDYITSGMVYNATFDSNQHVIKNQFRRGGTSATTYAKNSEIIAIKLNASVVSPPTYSQNSTNSTASGTPVMHSLNWTDDIGLSGYIFQFCNGTWNGTHCPNSTTAFAWVNDTWNSTNFNGLKSAWSNVTKVVNSTAGARIAWCVYANDTSNNWNGTSCQNLFTYNTAPGILIVNLLYPPIGSTTSVPQNSTFNVNASVTCTGGSCGTVYGTVRYNGSSSNPDTPISSTPGSQPFYNTSGAILQSCGNMNQYQSCQLNWTLNATGNAISGYKIGVLFNSSYNSVTQNHTNNATVKILGQSNTWLYLNWTQGGRIYNKSDIAYIYANCTGCSNGSSINLEANYTGTLSQISYIHDIDQNNAYNYTDTSNLALGSYLIRASTSDQDHAYSQVNYTLAVVDQIPPKYSNNSTNSTVAGKLIKFSVKWDDNTGLSYAIFSLDNCTGSFANITNMSLSGTSIWTNFTATINSTVGCMIQWKVYANDSGNNWNVSNNSFITKPSSINIWNLVTLSYPDEQPIVQTITGTAVIISVNVSGDINYVQGNFTWPNGTIVYNNLTQVFGKNYTHNWTYTIPYDMPAGFAQINVTAYDNSGLSNSTNTTIQILDTAVLSLMNYPINFSTVSPGKEVNATVQQGWPLLIFVQGNIPINLSQKANDDLKGEVDQNIKIGISNITWNTTATGTFGALNLTYEKIANSVTSGYNQSIYYKLKIPTVKPQDYNSSISIMGE